MVKQATRAGSLETQEGFTLIEVVSTTVIVLIAFLALLLAHTAIQSNNDKLFAQSVATQDAHQVMERIRNVATNGKFPENVIATYPDGGAVAGFDNLNNEAITVSYLSTATDPLVVTILVSWIEDGARNMTHTLHSIVTQRET